ncbi:MAG TPA: hypothetical protein ENN41_10650 [Sediminispirochaeta sp.]|nr:hypothetical protein [Sediminispirochaeta sp.]
MGEPAMEIGDRELEKIGEYVKSHLPQWIDETASKVHQREFDLLERVVRVEEELKSLREVMEERFTAVDERFNALQKQMDKRFEAQQTQMDKRFTTLQWTVSAGFVILAALIGAPLLL